MPRVALIGANGQLGSDIARCWSTSRLGQTGDELVGLTHADIEVTDEQSIRNVLGGVQPRLVINTSAFHRVDDCESDAETAIAVNALGVKSLAEVCRDLDAVLMHFSSDYVFSGDNNRPYRETDLASPVSAYGISKAAGEQFLRYVLPDQHVIIRSSGLYGVAGASGKGGNFVETMQRLAREGRPIRVVNDQVSVPTSTFDLAQTLLEVIGRGGRGTFHITNAGQCNWYEFAQEIFSLLKLEPDLTAISTEQFGAIARRPAFSVLENTRLRELGIDQPRRWQDALAHYLRLKGRLTA